MDKETLYQFEARCIQDEPPACQTMCPIHLDARAFIKLMAAGKFDEARKTLDKVMPLSGLAGYLCSGPCRPHCRRAEIDEGIDLPLLERLCVMKSRPTRLLPLPPGSKRAALFGAGLSSLALAWELGRKGVAVKIYHAGEPGGALKALPVEQLPPETLAEAISQLKKLRVNFEESLYSPELLAQALENNLAVFLGFDDPALKAEALGLPVEEAASQALTLATASDKIFAWPGQSDAAFIGDLAAGKRAAGSITRLGQGVPPSSAREGEALYPSKLYTNMDGVEVQHQSETLNFLAPTEEEAKTEAGRCLQCQCLECVKHCVYLQHYSGYPKKLARETYNNIATAFGIRTSNTMILSCAECGLCGVLCPNGADMADFIPLARQEMVEVKHMPVSAHEFALEDMLYSNAPEVSFWRHEPGRKESGWLFFPGCQLPASRPEATARVYEHLRNNLEGGVGLMMACCGAPARWSGRRLLTARVLEAFKKTWEEAGRPKLILACASCAFFFRRELPEIESDTLWNVLASLPQPKGTAAAEETLALHDPCAARQDSETLGNVRRLISALGQPFEEMAPGSGESKCCGYGGLADEANREIGDKFIADRVSDSGGRPILAHCIMCRDRLRKQGGPVLHLLDLLFPSASPMKTAMLPHSTISDRQEGRLAFTGAILNELWGEKPPQDELMNKNYVLNISPELEALMDRRRILRRDVISVLGQARRQGAQFINPKSGRVLSSYRPKQVTFWVEYSENDDGSYEIHDAYCHRMVVQGVPGDGADTAASLEGFDIKGGRR